MNKYKLVFTKQVQKDAKKLGSSGLKPKAQQLLSLLESDPLQQYPPYKSFYEIYQRLIPEESTFNIDLRIKF